MAYSNKQLEELVEAATLDCYCEEEEAMGFLSKIEEEVDFPFESRVLGAPVQVEGVVQAGETEILAICSRGGERQRVRLADLRLPAPPPKGAEWIAAYRMWLEGF